MMSCDQILLTTNISIKKYVWHVVCNIYFIGLFLYIKYNTMKERLNYIIDSLRNESIATLLKVESWEGNRHELSITTSNMGAVDIKTEEIADAWIKEIKIVKRKLRLLENSGYGKFGQYPPISFPFYNKDVADKITEEGNKIINKIKL